MAGVVSKHPARIVKPSMFWHAGIYRARKLNSSMLRYPMIVCCRKCGSKITIFIAFSCVLDMEKVELKPTFDGFLEKHIKLARKKVMGVFLQW